MAKEIFAQMSAGLDSNRKIMKAGRDGRDVFLWVLRQIALRASDGWVPAREVQDADWLARVLMCKPKEARDGLARAIDAELLRIEGDRCIAVGWTPSHGRTAQTGAERQAKYAARQNEAKAAKAHDASDAPVTEPSAPVTDADGSDAVTQGRKERKKEVSIPRQQATRKHLLPVDWAVPPELEAIAREEGVSLSREMAKLQDWARSKSAKYADWTGMARNWLRSAGEKRRKERRPPEVDQETGTLFGQRQLAQHPRVFVNDDGSTFEVKP